MSVRPSCTVFHDKQTTLFKVFSTSLNQPGSLLYNVFSHRRQRPFSPSAP